jgi:hypothetical protein
LFWNLLNKPKDPETSSGLFLKEIRKEKLNVEL